MGGSFVKAGSPSQDPHGLADEVYNRSRLAPDAADAGYLALADLRAALEEVRSDEVIRVLDYGCGGSPYRSLFPNAEYRRADCVDVPDLDYVFGDDEKIDAPDGIFDLVLSTQVLEHVRHPQWYLREAHRLLKPGGRLVASTHGLFEEHGAPIDFRRWTLEGLFCELEDAGFVREQGWKLTCGPRALLFWTIRHLWTGRPTWKSVFGAPWNSLRSRIAANPAWFNREGDRHFKRYGVMKEGPDVPSIYVGVFVVGRKKEGKS